jgi:hypothetical protein
MAKSPVNLITVFFLLTFSPLAAQEKIDTDRPDQTESAHTVPAHYLQLELGFNREHAVNKYYDLVHPTALLKFGFTKWELRLETTARSTVEPYPAGKKWTRGFEPVQLGFKAALLQEKKWLPKTSLIIHVALPGIASKSFRNDHLAPSFRFTMQNSLSEKWGLGYNLGAEWDGITRTPIWLYTLAPGMELFGFIPKNEEPQHSFDAGLAYYVTPDLKVDISSGLRLSPAAPRDYLAIGVSFRVNTAKP